MKLLFALILTLFITFMSSSQEKSKMEKFAWVIDNWISSADGVESFERWVKINDTLYTGESKTTQNGKEISSEKLRLEKIGDDIFYISDVKHNPAPVPFKLISISDTSAVFENPEHDFPTRIIYNLKDNSVLHARIEGPNKEGKLVGIDFIMTRNR